jgi:predicted PurR-regulated permease PerM
MYSLQRYRKTGFAMICLGLGLLVIYALLPIWTAVAWGAILAALIYPIHRRLMKRLDATVSALLTTLFALIAILLPLVLAGLAGVHEFERTVKHAQRELKSSEGATLLSKLDAQFAPALQKLGIPANTVADEYADFALGISLVSPGIGIEMVDATPERFSQFVVSGNRPSDMVRKLGDPAVKAAPALVREILRAAMLSGLALILMFFAVRDGHLLREPALQLIPLSRDRAEGVLKSVYDTIHATFYGVVLISFINGAIITLVYWMLGIPSPIIFGILTSIVSFIPIAGPPFVWIPTAIWLAANGQFWKGLLLALLGLFFIGLTVDKLYRSSLIGSRIKLHSMVVMFSLLGGMFTMGPIGAFIGPIIVILTMGALEVLREAPRET